MGCCWFFKSLVMFAGGKSIKKVRVFFFVFFKFREEAIDQMKHFRMEVKKMSFLLKRMMLRFLGSVFTEVFSMKMTMFLIGKIDVERWLRLCSMFERCWNLTNFGPMMKHHSSSRAQGQVPCSFKFSPFFKKPVDMKIKLSLRLPFFLLPKKDNMNMECFDCPFFRHEEWKMFDLHQSGGSRPLGWESQVAEEGEPSPLGLLGVKLEIQDGSY